VEGGQSTLIVTPDGESLLVDSGWSGAKGRDAKRIAATVHVAGLSQIDYLLITHFHSDHDGGVPELAKLVPIKTFIDYGAPTERGAKVEEPYEAYAAVRRKGVHLQPKVGDLLPLKGVQIRIVSGRGKTLTEPVPGAGQDNPACSAFKKKANDFTENAKSLGFQLVYGKFRFLDLGDLVWNELGQLVCPTNMIGQSDVYLVAHHGNAFSGVPAVMAAVRPRVAIFNNGETKGGDKKTFKTMEGAPGLEDFYQLHKSANEGVKQADEAFIANLDLHTAHRLQLTAREDGSFTMTNARTGVAKRYDVK
jgi:competence protein ComEC